MTDVQVALVRAKLKAVSEAAQVVVFISGGIVHSVAVL